MILIFGGAYQGKLAYAMERFGLIEEQVYRCSEADTTIPGGKRVIYEIDRWILALVQADMDYADALAQFVQENPNAIVICNDISCGVVPIDDTLRRWREETGRVLARLARQSDEVIRLFCGIPTQVK